MIFAVVAVLLAITSILIAFRTRKIDERLKPKSLVAINMVCLVGVVLMTFVGQLDTGWSDKAYKRAVFEIEALEQVNRLAIPVYDNLANISNNFNPIKNYIYIENAKKENLDAVPLLDEQQENIRKLDSFLRAEQSLTNLQTIATQIISTHSRYNGVMPQNLFAWAGTVLKIRIENMDYYLDPYARNENNLSDSVVSFYELTNSAFTASFEQEAKAVKVILELTK
jgi:hypothetical protein